MSKCPKCESLLSNVNIEEMPAHTKSKREWKAIAFVCPSCSTILGTQIDPHAMDTDLLSKIRGMMLSLPK
jgi:hypothetical protein